MAMKESSLGVTLSMAGIQVDPDSPAAAGGDQATYPGIDGPAGGPAGGGAWCAGATPAFRRCARRWAAARPDAEGPLRRGLPLRGGTTRAALPGRLTWPAGRMWWSCTLGGHYGWNLACTTGRGAGQPEHRPARLPGSLPARAVAPLGKPLVGVHFDGRPCSSDAADAVCGALVEAWAPGPEGGRALAAALTGAENFTGKLPCTVG